MDYIDNEGGYPDAGIQSLPFGMDGNGGCCFGSFPFAFLFFHISLFVAFQDFHSVVYQNFHSSRNIHLYMTPGIAFRQIRALFYI